MKILIIGSGGREHAIGWKIAQNQRVEKIYVASGNAFHKILPHCENVPLSKKEDLLEFAKENKIDLTIVGSEELLVEGIVDLFLAHGLRIFGANQKAAMLEGSKAFSKEFMRQYGVKTAESETFSEIQSALDYIETANYPLVVKASGLAAGKGVVICQTYHEAKKTIEDMMLHHSFGHSGQTIVIERYLEGVEVSILSITDSKTILPFISAKDHKKILEKEQGLNTGGMGVIAPNPYYTQEVEQAFLTDILNPTLKGIQQEKMDFIGVIFFGLMVCNDGVYLLEYNMRFGDPETQAVLPLLENDLLDLIEKAEQRQLSDVSLSWKKQCSCSVVMASGGYPEQYQKGYKIEGILETVNQSNIYLFLAGVKEENQSFLTSGGRVLHIVGLGDSAEEARSRAYEAIKGISFKDAYCRKDIGVLYQ